MQDHPSYTTPFPSDQQDVQIEQVKPQEYYPGLDEIHQIAFENQMMANAVSKNP